MSSTYAMKKDQSLLALGDIPNVEFFASKKVLAAIKGKGLAVAPCFLCHFITKLRIAIITKGKIRMNGFSNN